jgi:deoxyribodipyrimidine photo-lyase
MRDASSDLFADQAIDLFPPTLAAAQARLAAVRPGDYARTRNALDGAVTRLSPYITHGFLSLPEVLAGVLQKQRLDLQHKFVMELAWRDYFQHVWQHLGDGIFESLHAGPLPEDGYARELPADIRQGATGVPVVDQAVRTLYTTGWLHNHARMWLASYVVHVRKLHWRSGADWMFAQLLDGDLASNHLSWQWVAGTGSHKPYLFNAENVARYAPSDWHSPGTVIDTSYEALDRIAHSPRPAKARTVAAAGVDEPALLQAPPPGLFGAPDAAAVQGRAVMLVHPWNLGAAAPAGVLKVGVAVAQFHRRWPWTERRWRFVGERMRQSCALLWHADAQDLQRALAPAARVDGRHDPHLAPWFAAPEWAEAPRLFAPLPQRCNSFSQFWQRATRGMKSVEDVLRDTAN